MPSCKCKPLYCICGAISIPQRIVAAFICVMGVTVGYGQRASLSIAITRIVSASIRNLSDECKIINASNPDEHIGGGTYDWSEATQGWLLNGFYVGYAVAQIPFGMLCDYLGARFNFLLGVSIASALSVGTPFVIQYTEWYLVYVIRILLGMAQSVIYPAMSVVVAHWVPPSERATIGAFCFSSNSLGTVLGNLISGFIMAYTNSWPNTFFFWGISGFMWCGLCVLYVYDTPQKHPHVTEEEKAYLEKEVPRHKARMKIPFKRMFTDRGILALIIAQLGHDFTLYLMMTNMPKYFSDVLHMSVRDLSLVTSIPFVGIWILSIITGRILDNGIRNRGWDVKWSRSVTTYISFVIPNSMLVVMVYMECEVVLSALCFAIAVIFKGPHFAGFKVNHMDISVNFNGIIMSVVNTSGTLGGFCAPLIVSYLAPNNKLSEWKMVIWIFFILGGAPLTYYLFMAKGERAEWDVPEDELEQFKADKAAKQAAKQSAKQAAKDAKKAKKEAKKAAKEAKKAAKEAAKNESK